MEEGRVAYTVMVIKMKVIICGCKGKMGTTCLEYFKDKYELIPIDNCKDCLNHAIHKADVVIDFTNADSAFVNGVISLTHGVPVIIGTTGLSENQKETLKKIATKKEVGCIISSNFSIGMLWIKRNINEISKYFNKIQIIEEHHKSKLDTPSGSALSLQAIMNASGKDISSIRSDDHNVRHKIILENDYEYLTVEHIVKDRSAYMIQLGECIEDIHNLHAYMELE